MRGWVLAAALLLGGCATRYQDMTLGLGVSADAMGGDVYRVTAHLNSMNRAGDIDDFLFLRAAEAARESGAEGFVVLAQRDETKSGTVVVPGSSSTTAFGQSSGGFASGTATTTYTPPRTYEINNPGSAMLIRLVRGGDRPHGYIDAAATIEAISPRVKRGLGRIK